MTLSIFLISTVDSIYFPTLYGSQVHKLEKRKMSSTVAVEVWWLCPEEAAWQHTLAAPMSAKFFSSTTNIGVFMSISARFCPCGANFLPRHPSHTLCFGCHRDLNDAVGLAEFLVMLVAGPFGAPSAAKVVARERVAARHRAGHEHPLIKGCVQVVREAAKQKMKARR